MKRPKLFRSLGVSVAHARAQRAPSASWALALALALTGACGKSTTPASPGSLGGASGGGGGLAGAPGSAPPDASTAVDAPAMGGNGGGGGDPIVDAALPPVDLGPPPMPRDAAPVADASTTATRVNVNMDPDWRWRTGDVTGADTKAFDDTTWTYVDLPHTAKFVIPEDPFATLAITWYRKHFTVPVAYQGAKVFIEFGAAMQLADVWVNGVHKVQHQGGYVPFTIDVTGDVAYGGADNVIAVKLDNHSNAAWPPGQAGVDFQFDGGLYRHVTMHVTNVLHVTDAVYANRIAGGGVFVTYPVATTTSATVNIKTNVINESTVNKNATVISRILDAGGQMVGMASTMSAINAGASVDVVQSVVIANPKLWHPYTPVLYTLQTTVQDGTTAVDESSTRIGIRTVQWTHAGLIINGARFKALGVNMLEETYGLGNAVSDQSIFLDVKRVRDGGMTFIRGSHYPHAPAFYDACDALGVLVMDSETGWQFFSAATAFVNATYQELRDMIRRDRNHPSVVVWEANLNESLFTDAWAQAANSIVHTEYPGAFSAAWPATGNFFADIFIDASQHNIRASTQTRPIIINEYGDWDYGGNDSTTRQAREAGDTAMLIQCNNVQDGQSKNQAVPWFSADGYWDYSDYGGYAGITHSGLMDMYRLPKFAYYFLQSQRDPAVTVAGVDSGPMVFIANQWTSTSPTTVRVFSNCDQVSLSLNGTLVSTRSPDTGTTLIHPPFTFAVGAFTAGTLRADCLIGGTQRATVSRQTPGVATALRLRPEATTLRADRGDARLVFIDVVDANGTVVPSDNRAVTLAVTGAGSLIGPTAITMKGGQLAAWVRPTRTAGAITLTATATGLTAGTTTLTSVAVTDLTPAPQDRP